MDPSVITKVIKRPVVTSNLKVPSVQVVMMMQLQFFYFINLIARMATTTGYTNNSSRIKIPPITVAYG